jgi:hypothetical protein
VPEQEERFIRLPLAHHINVNAEHIYEIVKSLYVHPRTTRLAVPEVVDTIDGIAKGDKVIDNVHMASTVFS